MKRLSTEKSLAPYVAQFVPLKLDVASPEYASLQRKHQSEGNSIPKIFLIRADGQKLYAKSGSLPGQQLNGLVLAAVEKMGRPLSISEAKSLTGINDQIKKALDEQDYRSVAVQFQKTRKLGEFGQIPSFAQSAVTHNELADLFQKQVSSFKSQLLKGMDSENKLVNAIQAIQLKSELGSFPALRVSMNELEKQVRNAIESNSLLSELRVVASALIKLNHQSSKIRQQSAGKLVQFANSNSDPLLVKFIQEQLEQSGVTPVTPEPVKSLRTWTSEDGKFSTEAMLVNVGDGKVKLKKKSGEVISVPLDRLSKGDRDYLAQLNK